jgi:IclR family transcriptional regulator, KDG regulon repressor
MLNTQIPTERTDQRTRAKSADRALQVLEYLATVPEGTTFTDIARSLSLPKSSTHELLAVLAERSFIEFNQETKAYRIGIRTWELGQAFVSHRDLLTEARPVIAEVAAKLDETVQISVRDGLEEVYLDRVDSSQPLRVQAIVGSRAPAHTTALGKVLLADRRESDILHDLRGRKLQALTPNTITAPEAIIDELRWVRLIGFAIDDQEHAIGLRCVAVPIRDHHGSTVAAMSVAVPITRGSAEQLTDALLAVEQGARQISRKLGCDSALLGLKTGDRANLHELIAERLDPVGRPLTLAGQR